MEDIDLRQYRENARANNLCAEYTKIWDNCKSNKQIMDMALDVKGLDYLGDSIAKGWGISPDNICSRFYRFINGNYTRDKGGYTSKMYCRHYGKIIADTTAMLLIDCEGVVDIPRNNICEIYCTGRCMITATGEGEAVFVCYGDPDNIKIIGTCRNMKRINKKNRDTYDE